LSSSSKEYADMILHAGIEHAVRHTLGELNQIRTRMGLPPFHLAEHSAAPRRGRPRKSAAADAQRQIHEAPAAAAPPAPRKKPRRMTPRQKQHLATLTRARWDVIRKAGLKTSGRLPTAAEVARAQKILERKNAAA
jgi:hypothetical protein